MLLTNVKAPGPLVKDIWASKSPKICYVLSVIYSWSIVYACDRKYYVDRIDSIDTRVYRSCSWMLEPLEYVKTATAVLYF